MRSKYAEFDRSRLIVKPLADRIHELHADHWLALEDAPVTYEHPQLDELASRVVRARERGAARILMMGAHVLRAGVNRQIIDLVERGAIDHIAMNGAGAIHDYELARIGATTESVARYIRTGEFGLWRETGELNDWVGEAARMKLGLGENVGRRMQMSDYPYKDLSVLAAAWRCSVPVTVHVGIGYDILHEHPNCDGAALGAASYRDFLIFAATVERLESGVTAELRIGHHGAGSLPEGAGDGPQRRAPRGPDHPRFCDRGIRPGADRRATFIASRQRPIRHTISVRIKQFWCARWRMGARVSISAATIAPLSRRFGARF